MRYCNKKTLFLIALFAFAQVIINDTHGRTREFETTHLKSMGGTGVASILAEEAAFLNPASLAFFSGFTGFAQLDTNEHKNASGNLISKTKSKGFALADGNQNLSGSLSYVEQDEKNYSRERWGFSASSPLSKQSAFGTSLRKSKDLNLQNNTETDYYQTVVGVTHILDDKTSLGIVAYDIFNSAGNATMAILGIQHVLLDYITGAVDFGADYTSDEISKNTMYRGALQVKVLNDFYLRFGTFKDKIREEKGNGMGLAWIQPRLAFGFALKNTTEEASTKLNRAEFTNKETSFSLSMRF